MDGRTYGHVQSRDNPNFSDAWVNKFSNACGSALVALARRNSTKNENIHPYNTRSASKIHVNYQRTNYAKFPIEYRGAQIWKSSPKSLKKETSYNLFKSSVKSRAAIIAHGTTAELGRLAS